MRQYIIKKTKELIHKALYLQKQGLNAKAIAVLQQAVIFDPEYKQASYLLSKFQQDHISIRRVLPSTKSYRNNEWAALSQGNGWTASSQDNGWRYPQTSNNEWKISPSIPIHPFNCRCAKCVEF